MSKRQEYHIKVNIRDKNFNLVEEFTCSGPMAIVDTMYHLDEKYNPEAWDILKRFW